MPQSHDVAPGQQALQLDVPLILPGVEDENDGCVARLQDRLSTQTGVAQVHLSEENGHPVLCLHYDPNLVPLEKLERLARDEGAGIVRRFRHETLPVKGMDCASCAASIEHVVRKVPGVLTASVSYPVQKMKVEYDSTVTDRTKIIKAVSRLGYRVPQGIPLTMVSAPVEVSRDHHEHSHDHGHECNGHDHEGHTHQHERGAHTQDDHTGHSHAGHNHAGHSHGDSDENAPWWVRNFELALSITSGVLLALAFGGERFLGVPTLVAVALYVLSYIAGGYNLARHAIPTILAGRFDVEFLMLAGAAGAAFLGQWAEGAFLLFLFSLGHALEHHAMERARSAIAALGNLTPKVARVRREGQELEIPVETVRIGDLALVRPGDRVPVDGIVKAGTSAIDQSPITGESVPVEKETGDNVFAGSINGEGALEVEVTQRANDTTIARVIQMVEEAQTQKAPSQVFSETFERIFVPVILGVVVLAAILPPLFGWLVWKESLLRAISTLVAASPCALALATPAAVLAGIAQAARNGVLIKGGVHLENLGSLNAIAFDKTGTLTQGQPEVTDIAVTPGSSEAELLRLAGAVETHSSHPLAQAVVRRAKGATFPTADAVQALPGRGVQAVVEGKTIRIGNVRMFQEANIAVPPPLLATLESWGQSGKPTMIIGVDQSVIGVLGIADQVRPEANTTLQKLRALGVKSLIMLTGDNARVAGTVAPQIGLTEFRADLLPQNKVEALTELMNKYGGVAVVGDGVNDAPALAHATVGIAMGSTGTDVALETADVALMGDDLSKLPFAVGLSRQARSIIRQNLWIALGVIALLVPSTLLGVAHLSVAVVFHEGSTIIVCLNALRLLRYQQRG